MLEKANNNNRFDELISIIATKAIKCSLQMVTQSVTLRKDTYERFLNQHE